MDAEPAWITDGARVVEFTGDAAFAAITLSTISELTPLWIVLTNGNRYYRTTLRPYGADDDSGPELVPANDPRVRDTLAVRILARAIAGIHALERGEPARTAADVMRALDQIGALVLDAQLAVSADDIADTARAAEGSHTDASA